MALFKIKDKKAFIKEVVNTLLLILVIFAFRWSVAEPYVVPTGSMEPTILPGDRLVVLKTYYDLKFPFTSLNLMHFREPARGDIIVFRYPVDPSIDFVKRLIGLPGDEIDVVDGVITINGKALELKDNIPGPVGARTSYAGLPVSWKFEKIGTPDHLIEHYVQRIGSPGERNMDLQPMKIKVPADHYFFMGDNRDNSSDSRVWGFVPKENLKGRAVMIWLSFDPDKDLTDFFSGKFRYNRIGNKL